MLDRRKYEITFYEGLIRKTAAIYAPRIQEEYEDIVSILRIKAWRALVAYDPERSTQQVEKFVFSCVTNQVKDLLKRKRRHEVYLADMPRTSVDGDELADGVDQRYLSVSDEIVYADVERELPLIPSTLTGVERDILVRLYLDANQRDIALELGLSRADMVRSVRSIRLKMADWQPSSVQPVAVAA